MSDTTSSPIITEAMVEKVARALFGGPAGEWDQAWARLDEYYKDKHRRDARTAILSALPMIVEECAKVAEGPLYKGRYRGGASANWSIDGSSPYGDGRLDAAAAIRSLSPSKEQEG